MSIRCSHVPSMLNELKSVRVLMILNPLNMNGIVSEMGLMDELSRERGGRVAVGLNELVRVSVFVPRCLYPVMCFGVVGSSSSGSSTESLSSSGSMTSASMTSSPPSPTELPIPSFIDWVIGTRTVISKYKDICESLLNGLNGCDNQLNLSRVFYRGSPLKKVNNLFDELELDGGCFDWCGECEVCDGRVLNSMKEWKGKKFGVGLNDA